MSTEKLHDKIRGLLRKAESTPYEEEAAVFFRKAQELIAKYAVDQEALWASDPSKREEIITVEITIIDKQAGSNYRRDMLNRIARNNRCRCWYIQGRDTSIIAGYPSDTAFVEMLYASIVTYMNFRLADAIAREERKINGRTYRKEFTAGFATRINQRLAEQKQQIKDYVSEYTGSTDLVLVDRERKVDQWVNENTNLVAAPTRYDTGKTDSRARGAGHMAANNADLSGGRGGTVKGGRKGITSG